jgi:hypothetical protein
VHEEAGRGSRETTGESVGEVELHHLEQALSEQAEEREREQCEDEGTPQPMPQAVRAREIGPCGVHPERQARPEPAREHDGERHARRRMICHHSPR